MNIKRNFAAERDQSAVDVESGIMNIFCLANVFLVLCFGATVERWIDKKHAIFGFWHHWVFLSHFTLIGPRKVQYKSIYKCILSHTYNKRDQATVDVIFHGKDSEKELDSHTFKLEQNALITVSFNVSKIFREPELLEISRLHILSL